MEQITREEMIGLVTELARRVDQFSPLWELCQKAQAALQAAEPVAWMIRCGNGAHIQATANRAVVEEWEKSGMLDEIIPLTASPAPDHAGDSNEMPGWEPIETAPMDGTHIQLYRPKIQFIGYYGGANSGWRHNAPGLDSVWPLPTHWMPLPNPPSRRKQSDEEAN